MGRGLRGGLPTWGAGGLVTCDWLVDEGGSDGRRKGGKAERRKGGKAEYKLSRLPRHMNRRGKQHIDTTRRETETQATA